MRLSNIKRFFATSLLLLAIGNIFAVNNSENDFLRRAGDPGVIYFDGFDSPLALERRFGKQSHNINLDYNNKSSGRASLQFTIPSNSSAHSSGSWRINFIKDNQYIKFGSGQDLYIQWRQMFSSSMLSTIYKTKDGTSGGWKSIIIGEGDYKREKTETGACSKLEVVLNNANQKAFPQLYHSCGDYWPLIEKFKSMYNSYDFKLQNAISALAGVADAQKYVLYSQEKSLQTRVRNDFPGVAFYPNEWMTFQIHIAPGPLGCAIDPLIGANRCGFINSKVDMWIGREGQPSVKTHSFEGLVLQRKDRDRPSGEKYGKIWLTTYHTNKDPTQNHAVGYTWYDELIVSTKKIKDPGI